MTQRLVFLEILVNQLHIYRKEKAVKADSQKNWSKANSVVNTNTHTGNIFFYRNGCWCQFLCEYAKFNMNNFAGFGV